MDQAVDAEREDRGRRVGHGEELRRGLVDALVGRLRRQHDGHQQFERRRVFELRSDAGWPRAGARKSRGASADSRLAGAGDRRWPRGEPCEPRRLVGGEIGVVLEHRVRLRRPGSRRPSRRRAPARSRPVPRRRRRRFRRLHLPREPLCVVSASSRRPTARRPRADRPFRDADRRGVALASRAASAFCQ